jgi:hypothetical protein
VGGNKLISLIKTSGVGVQTMKHSTATQFRPMKNIIPLLAIALLSLAGVAHAASTPSVLQFRWVEDNPTADSEPMTIVQPDNSLSQPEVLNVQKAVLLDQSDVKSAKAYVSGKTGGQLVIGINFTDDGTKRFAEATRQNIGRRLAVVIDGKLSMAPRINSAIDGGVAQITGAFSKLEAQNIAARLNGSSAREGLPGGQIVYHTVVFLLFVGVAALAWFLIRKGRAMADS